MKVLHGDARNQAWALEVRRFTVKLYFLNVAHLRPISIAVDEFSQPDYSFISPLPIIIIWR